MYYNEFSTYDYRLHHAKRTIKFHGECARRTLLKGKIMKFNTMIGTLNSSESVQLKFDPNNPEISKVVLLNDANDSTPQKDCLYIKNGNNCKITNDPKYIIKNDGSIQKGSFGFSDSKLNTNDIFDEANLMLKFEAESANDIIQLAINGMSNCSLQSIIDQSAEILQDPLLVIDTDYKSIGYSKNYDISDPLWKKIIEDNYAPYDLLLHINEIVKNSNPNNQNQPFLVNCDLSPVHKLAIKLMWNDFHIGYIVMFNVPNPINLRHKVLLPKIAELIAQIISKSSAFNKLLGDPKHRILTNLIEQQQPQAIAISMKNNDLKIPKTSTMLLFKNNKVNGDSLLNPEFYEDKVKSIFVDSFVTTIKNSICILAPRKLSNSDIINLNDFASNYQVQIMIGNCYSDFFKSNEEYQYLLKAINSAGTELKGINHVQNYSFNILTD